MLKVEIWSNESKVQSKRPTPNAPTPNDRMATRSLSTFTCPTAELGPENPHAPLTLPYPVVAHYQGQDMPVDTCLPYRLQDGYARELEDREHKVAILESDTLRAMFLLDLGGRLWSLIHKPTGRELLYVNPVIQFARSEERRVGKE